MGSNTPAWTVVVALALPAAASAQDGDVDSIPGARTLMDVPRDPLNLGVKELAYALGLKISEVWDDNVFLTSDNEKSDRITVALVWGEALYKREAGEARLAYRGRERLYAKNDELDGMEHFLDASGLIRASNFRFEGGVEWRAMKETFDPLEVREPVDSRFDREFISAGADYNTFDVSLTAELAHFAVDDELHDRGDYERLGFALLGAARVWPQAEAFAEVLVRSTDYDEEFFSDFTFYRFAVGARGSFTAKIRGEARLGLGRTETDDGGTVSSDDFSGVVAEASVTWDVNEKHEVTAGLHFQPSESVLTGLAIEQGIRAGWRFRITERLAFRASARWSRETDSEGNGERTGIQWRAGARWESAGRFFADAGVLYRAAEADVAASEYDNVRFGIGVGVEW